jgi:hypothetical protein
MQVGHNMQEQEYWYVEIEHNQSFNSIAYTPNAVTLDMTGAVNTGNQNIALSTAGNII